MTDDIRDRLAVSLNRQVDSIDVTRPLAHGAYGRAKRIRLRRRLATGVACLATLAVALPAGAGLLPETTGSIQPAKPPASNRPVNVTIDIDKLPKGPAPQSPWFADGVIHNGDRKTNVGNVPTDASAFFTPVADGYVVRIEGSADPVTTLIGLDGKTKKTLRADSLPVASPDGTSLAWMTFDATGESSNLVLADAGTGAIRKQKQAPVNGATPVGFVGTRVAFGSDTADGGGTQLWNTETGRLSNPGKIGNPLATDGTNLLAAQTKVTAKGTVCTGIFDVSAKLLLSEKCNGIKPTALYGQYAWGQNDEFTKAGLIEPGSGKDVLVLTAAARGGFGRQSVEPDGSLLLLATKTSKGVTNWAIVRCSTAGACELASEQRPATQDNAGMPYMLPGLPTSLS